MTQALLFGYTLQVLTMPHISKTFQVNENNPTKEQLENFVNDNFDPEASEFEEWEPSDWNEDIPVFNKITVMYL